VAEFLAIHQTDAARLACLLRQLASKVALGGPDAVAGVGYIESDDVLLRKRPLAGRRPVAEKLAEGVLSEAVVIASGSARAQVRSSFSEETTFPFRFRRWIFSMAGAADALALARPRLLQALPDHLRRSVRGDTAAEALFFNFLSRLRDAGRLDDSDADETTVARALASSVGEAERSFEQTGAKLPAIAAVATNGRVMAVVRRGHPVFVKLHEGIFGCPRCELPADAPDNDPKVRAHRMLRALVVATSEQAAPEGFRPLEDGEVLAIGRGLSMRRVV
jgi:glutamine amidotransferase